MSADLGIQGTFPPPDLTAWRALVERDLKGASFEKKLLAKTDSGIDLHPLYTRADWGPEGDPSGLPGFGDRTRGATPLGNALGGWTIACDVDEVDPSVAASAVAEAVAGGGTGIDIHIPTAWGFDQLDTALASPKADTWLTLRAGASFHRRAPELVACWQRRGLDPAKLRGCFAADPLSVLAAEGHLHEPLEQVLSQVAGLASYVRDACSGMYALEAGAHVYHSAGASHAQELAFGLATGLEYLRALTECGLDVDAACAQLTLGFSVDQDFILNVAKLRAARRLWARIVEVSGGSGNSLSAPLIVRTGRVMATARAPWVNLLRGTVAAFAAAVGGANAITVLPFDTAVGRPDALARRLARNTQLILQGEVHLHQVVDPAGGAYAFERITDELASAAWSLLQQVEARGGLAAALAEGWIAERIAESREAKQARVAFCRDAITGVSAFPHLDEEALERASARDSQPSQSPALPSIRLAEPFEALRDRSDAVLSATGARPQVFLACLGSLADHTARSTWVENLLATGGMQGIRAEGHASPAEAALAYAASGARIAVICSTDAIYAESAADLATALRDAGAALVVLAGHPRDRREAYQAAGVGRFVHVGVDVLAFLRDLWKEVRA